jgi:tetratricopeptide (TPR) repeat protein
VKEAQDDPQTSRTPQREEVRKAQAERAYAFYQRLLQENRSDPAGRFQTALVYRRLPQVYSMRGDVAKAVEAYHQSVALLKQLAAEFPADARYQQELAKTHIFMQQLIRFQHNVKTGHDTVAGRYQEAAKTWQHVVTMSEALTAEQPDDPDDWLILGVASYWLGREQWLAGQTKEGEESISKALPIFGKLEGDTANGPEMAWREAAFAYLWRGSIRAESGRLADAEADYRQTLAMCDKLAKASEFWFELQRYPFASAQEALGDVLWATDRKEAAAGAYRRAEQTRAEILRSSREPKSFALYIASARFYASCPDVQFRDPAKAVEFAKEAVEKVAKSDHPSPREEGEGWQTLGIAQYRVGDWKATVAALEKAMRLRNGGDAADWFFLAMAHRQQGDKQEARRWWDRAVVWMDKNKPRDEELGRFRAEAAALLRIDEGPKGKPARGRDETGGR